jgi:hypothetical protein
MSQESERPGPPAPTVNDPPRDTAPARAAAPLAVVVDVVSASGLGVERADIDSLLAALERPLPPDESPRARADLLLKLLARDSRVGDLEGTNGTKVRRAAREALLALGPPYALELPHALAMDPPPASLPTLTPPARSAESDGPGRKSVGMFLGSAVYQTLILAGVAAFLGMPGKGKPLGDELAGFNCLWFTFIWLNVLVSVLGHSTESRTTQIIATVGLWAQFAGWAGLTLMFCAVLAPLSPLFLLVMPWHLTLYSALKMGPTPTTPPAPTAPPTPTP